MRLKGPFRKVFGMSVRNHGHHINPDLGGQEYQVPFVHQNHCNLCGDSSAQMLLLFNNYPASAPIKNNAGHANSWRMRRNPRGILEGANDDDVANIIKAAGMNAWNIYPQHGGWTANLVLSALQTYGPYAQSVRFSMAGHWVVVVGVDGNHVIYHDPWRGQNMRKTEAAWRAAAFYGQDSAVAATNAIPVHVPQVQAQQK